jgi:hypothetical protein
MLTGLLAVLIAGHVVGSVEGGSSRGYPTYDRDYYGRSGGYGGYGPYGGCGRGYADCGGYGGYSYRGYDYRYSYRSYDYDYGYRSDGY